MLDWRNYSALVLRQSSAGHVFLYPLRLTGGKSSNWRRRCGNSLRHAGCSARGQAYIALKMIYALWQVGDEAFGNPEIEGILGIGHIVLVPEEKKSSLLAFAKTIMRSEADI